MKENTKNKFEMLLLHHHAGSASQRNGNYSKARDHFNTLLELTGENALEFTGGDAQPFHAGALFHLGQMAEGLEPKRHYLERCLQIDNRYRMAAVLLSCLTPEMEKRLAQDKEGMIKPFFERYPLNVQIQTTSTCNAKCKMCPYHHSWQKKNPGRMSDETFTHIIGLLKGIPLGKVCLYLENEPLTDKKIFQRIEIVKRELRFKLIEVSTNGQLLSDNNIGKLHHVLKDTPHMVWISWHGITPAAYKDLMGLNFEANLEKLKRYFTITKGELCTSVNSIVGSKLNPGERYAPEEETVEFFREIIREAGVDPDHENIFYKPFYFHNRAEDLEKGSIADESSQELIGKLKPWCCRIKEWLHFLYDGDMILCCMDYHKESLMNNVMDSDSLEQLLSRSAFSTMQQQALGKMKTPEDFICKRCISPGG